MIWSKGTIFLSRVILFLYLFSNHLNAQSYAHKFIGTIQLEDKSIITYKLLFSIDAENNIEGKSISDFNGEHRTESHITGKIDVNAQEISFNETTNISTKSDFPDSSFCYIYVPKGKIKLRKKKSIIQGHFWGKYPDGSACLEGDVYLIGEDQFFTRIEKRIKKTRFLVSKEEYQKAQDIITEEKKKSSKIVMKENQKLRLKTSLDTVTLVIFDPQKEDNDKVAIHINNKIVFPSIDVKKKATRVSIPILGETTIGIQALNEGDIPPNSAKIVIENSSNTDQIEINLDKGKKTYIIFEPLPTSKQ